MISKAIKAMILAPFILGAQGTPDAAACAVKGAEARNKYINALAPKDRPRRNLLGVTVTGKRQEKRANELEDATIAACLAGAKPTTSLEHKGAIANEYDAGGTHHVVITMDDQTVNTTRFVTPTGTESKVLFTTGGQTPKYYFLDEKDAGAVKEVVPGEGEGTYRSKTGTFTMILRDDKADIYPAPAKTQP